MRLLPIGFMLILAGYLGPGCKSSKKAAQETELPAVQARAALPQSLKIVCGQGGGFTGSWQGFTINGNGQVLSWEGQQAESNPEPAGELAPDSLQLLWNQLHAMDFMSIEMEEYANMTAIIEVQTAEGTNRVSWLPKLTSLEPLETPIDSFYVRCTNMASGLK